MVQDVALEKAALPPPLCSGQRCKSNAEQAQNEKGRIAHVRNPIFTLLLTQ